jgi:hypothetical protein
VLTHAIEQSHFEELIFAQLSRNSLPFMVEARSFITTPPHSTSVRSIFILSLHLLICKVIIADSDAIVESEQRDAN